MLNSSTAKDSYILPDYIKQDSNDSVTIDGFYDMEHISFGEKDVVVQVLHNAKRKYPNKFQSIGLYNEGNPIMYKPRYLIFQIIILKYENSHSPIDQFAVALAYATKGSYGRQKAIEHLESAMKNIQPGDLEEMSRYTLLWKAFSDFSDIYEHECEYDLALLYAKTAIRLKGFIAPYDVTHQGEILQKVDINKSVEYYQSLLKNPMYESFYSLIQKELEQVLIKQKKGYKFRPRKRHTDSHTSEFEKKIQIAAEKFI
jgi:hypothetical protein